MKVLGTISIFILFFTICQVGNPQPDSKPPPHYRPPLINLVKPNKTTIAQYEKLEITVVISASYDNPFDPDEIQLEARIKYPDGRSVTVPGFYYQEYQRTLIGNKEEMKKYMEPCWEIRFTPNQVGTYEYSIRVQDRYRIVHSESLEFNVTPSDKKGFIRTSFFSPYYFQTDNGDPYFAIGHNVGWAGTKGTYDYDKYFNKMSAAGENYTRIWMVNWNLGLEYPAKLDPEFDGLGRYNLANAYRLDYILDIAEKKGIYVMLCLDSFSNLKTKGSMGQFKNYPYSAAQLGPCDTPEEFFTNEKAKQYYKKRLRYIVARYGYSTHLLAWEFWNEVDLTDNYNSVNVTKWHREMAQYVREIDVQKHLITTSFANSRGDDHIWELPEIDIVQSHMYNVPDISAGVHDWCVQKTNQYRKPHIFAEFGLDSNGKLENEDSSGLYLHNGIWSALMNRSAGTAMSWWWDSYIDPNDLYKVYTGLAKFVRGIPFSRNSFRLLKQNGLRYATPNAYETYQDAIVRPSAGWGDNTNGDSFTITPSGTIADGKQLNMYLQGTSKQEIWITPKFNVDYPSDGKFIVHIKKVSNNAVFKISLDNKVVYTHDFIPTSGRGDWKEENYNSEYKVYQNVYDQDYGIQVSKGKHVIELENDGTDWISISFIRLTQYVSSNIPNLRIYGIQTKSQALFWIQNKDNSWYNRVKDVSPTPVENAVFKISGLQNGRYKLEWYNTNDNKLKNTWTMTNLTGTMTITIPEIRTDLAAKLYLISD